jgi:hypothetical protein
MLKSALLCGEKKKCGVCAVKYSKKCGVVWYKKLRQKGSTGTHQYLGKISFH